MQKPELNPEFWKNFLKKPLALENVEAFYVVALDQKGRIQSVTNMSAFSALGMLESIKARIVHDQVAAAKITGERHE